MATHLRFLHVCERQFAGLPGDDPQQRRCDTCDTVVHNLDALTSTAREQLLARAREEQTTVCVSASLTPERSQACRAGAPVVVDTAAANDVEVVPLAGVVMPMPVDRGRLPPIQEGEPGVTWRSFAADLPAVDAALAVLAPGLLLLPDGEHAWHLHAAEQDLEIDVVTRKAGDQTAVGLRVAPPLPVLSDPVVTPPYLALTVLIAGPLLAIAAGWSSAELLRVFFLLIPVYGLTLLLRALVHEHRRRRARARFIALFHARFWPALSERLAERQPYR